MRHKKVHFSGRARFRMWVLLQVRAWQRKEYVLGSKELGLNHDAASYTEYDTLGS